MPWIKRPSNLTTLAMALMLGLVLNVSVKAQLLPSSPSSSIPTTWNFNPPVTGNGAPRNTSGGATRGDCLSMRNRANPLFEITALVPEGTVAKTVAAYPTFYWYVPRGDPEGMKFVLKDENDKSVYETKFAINGSRGSIASLTIPDSASVSPLEIGKEYKWEVTVMCNLDPNDSSGNYLPVGGVIKRVPMDSNLASQLERATTLEKRLDAYATNRLWYDVLNTLAELRRTRPNDSGVESAWRKLLESIELDEIAQQPMFEGSAAVLNSAENTTASSFEF